MRNSSHKCSALWPTGSPLGGGQPDTAGCPRQAGPGWSSVTHADMGCHLIHDTVGTLARFLHKSWASLFTAFFLGGWWW